MKNIFTCILSIVLFCALGANSVWGATSTFTSQTGAVGSGEPAWVVAGANGYEYDRGIQWSAASGSLTNTSLAAYTITEISVDVSSNRGTNTLSVTVGGGAFGSSQTIANSNHQTKIFSGNASGTIVINVNGGNKSVYIKSVSVTYSVSSYTVTLSKNGTTTDIADLTGTYTLPTTGEHVANACEGWAWHCWANAAYSTGSPTSTAPSSTVITSMTSAGTAYAVYKHEEASGSPSTVTFAKADFSGDGTISATKSGVTVSCVGNIPSAGYVTFTEGNTLTISSSSGNITAIDFTCSGADYTGNMTDVSGISTSSWSINVSNPGSKTTVRVSSIIVTIGGGSTTTYTSLPDCTPCYNKVTLTKGEEDHGTFTLDKSNGEYNNCASNFVVTVSGITPESGYYCTGVTATGEHCSVTGPDGSGNYTVTYEMGNAVTSTITANFAPNPTYTVIWSMNGDESNTDSYEEGASIVFPGTAAGCDGKVFRGWSAAPVTETDVEPSYVTSATMPAHAVTYYAVYAEASTGSGAATLAKQGSSATFANGDNIVIVAKGTSIALYQETVNTSYVNNWSFENNATTVGGDAKNYLTLETATGGDWYLGDATNGYLYNSGSNNELRVRTDGYKTEWTIEWDNTENAFTINDGRYLTCRNDLSDDYYRAAASTSTGTAFFDIYKYVSGGGTTYSGYTTTCGPGISAQNVGWITTSAGQKVKRVISVSAKNFEDDVTLAATCANSHFAVTLGATAVPSGTTGLTTTLTVEYTPTDEGREENVEIVLTAGDKSRTIMVNGRCVPDEFLLITKKSDKWYALPANMTGGANEYDGVEVNPNNTTTPTAVAVSPTTIIYSLASVANSRYADNGHLVRLVGNSNKCLWGNKATGATKVNIQNYATLSESNGDNYEWDLKTTDGVHYFVESPCNAEYAEGRRLAYGTKFGMYKQDTEFFIVSTGCSSQPGEVSVSPRRVEATFSWVSNTTEMHIDLYTNDAMTEGHLAATASSSPYVFTGLEESKPYWYKLTPGTDAACAITGSFTTTGPLIDIVEWQENGVVLFIDKGDINPKIVIDGQEEHGSITGGGEATELFFAKYFEGAGSMKLVSIFNGTKDDINLSPYSIYVKMRGGGGSWSLGNDVNLDLGTLGSIKAGQEIIFFSRPLDTETALDGCSESFLNGKVATSSSADSNPRWVECDGVTFKRINFNGNDPILLRKSGTLIDVIGSEDGAAPTSTNCLSGDNEKGWAGTVRNMDKGKSPSDPAFEAFYDASSISPVTTQDSIDLLTAFGINLDDDEIPLTTARCIFFRDKRVQNGDSAVLMNGSTFVTFTNHDTFKSEWYGRSVCMNNAARTAAGVSDDAQATCNSYQDIANMNYNQYYIEWSNIDPGTELSAFSVDPETKEYTIPIDNMRQYACLNLRFQLVHEDHVLTEASQQVPIVVAGNVDTNDPLFSELVIDQTTHLPSYSHSLARCADCDVVVLGAASLTKGENTDPKDVPEVGNVKVYPGGKLVVPNGTTYTMKSLALRRQEDEVASADIQGTLNIGKTNGTSLDLRIDPTNWHFISLPYDVNVSDIRFANPDETAIPVLGTDYLLQWYDGERRAATKNDDAWEPVAADATLKAGLGYIFALPGEGKVKREFRFPMANDVITQESTNKTVSPVYGYGCDQPSLGSNHKGWNLVGAPYLNNYLSDLASPLRTGKLIEDHTSPEHNTPTWDGAWTDDGSSLRYIAIPINNGWDYYYQEEISGYELPPFTSYFVQIDGTDPAEPQFVGFHASQVGASPSPIIRRQRLEYEEEEDTHPVWCAIDLTNPQGETDKTTVLVSNDFTDDYDMMNDMVKMRGSYYSYYTRPVLASRNNEGEMAFNALPDASALAGIPLSFFAAGSGSYTFSFNERYGREEVKEVKLLDKNNGQWYDLLTEPYSFTTNRVDDKNRFVLSVRVERKKPQTPTGVEQIGNEQGDVEGCRKILMDGHIYILRGAQLYDVTGKQVSNRK